MTVANIVIGKLVSELTPVGRGIGTNFASNSFASKNSNGQYGPYYIYL